MRKSVRVRSRIITEIGIEKHRENTFQKWHRLSGFLGGNNGI